MKFIENLVIPKNDAVMYNDSQEKVGFLSLYNKTHFYDELMKDSCFYIIAEKGSGKTALALFFANDIDITSTVNSKLVPINAVDYNRFIQMKIKKKLEYSDYSSIWRTIILQLVAQLIVQKESNIIHRVTGKFKKIEKAIKDFDENAVLPEMETIREFTSTFETNDGVMVRNKQIGGAEIKQTSTEAVNEAVGVIRHHLLELEKSLKAGLQDISLQKNVVLLLDGLDARPSEVSNEEFFECLSGLESALWHLNVEFFSVMKNQKKRIRICVLLRPDIFNELHIYNSNCKISDNSVVLNWETKTTDYRNSDLFHTIDKYFTSQNNNDPNMGWDAYFPEKDSSGNSKAFIWLLNNSFQRPRDLFTAIKILITEYKKKKKTKSSRFMMGDILSNSFTTEFANYLLGEVRNYANIYVSNNDFAHYQAFFRFLDGASEFYFAKFDTAYKRFIADPRSEEIINKKFLSSSTVLLQFFFDCNIIGYKEYARSQNDEFIHWSYRERSVYDIMPHIKTDKKLVVFSGLKKALDIGVLIN